MNAPAAAVTTARAVSGGRPRMAGMIRRQVRHLNRGFWRTPIAAFFTLAFPVLFLVLLGSLIGNETVTGTDVRIAQYLTPAVAAFAAVTASFTTLAISLTIDRDRGVLKRLRGSPLPPWAYMTARMLSMAWVSLLATAIMIAVGVVFLDVQIIVDRLPAAIITLFVGITAFAGLGVAVAALAPSNEAASALSNATIVPLAFISDVFVQGAELPRWLDAVAWFFPLKHFAHGLRGTFDPFEAGAGFAWDHIAVMLAWGVAGLMIALWRFRWEPRTAGSPGTISEAQPVAHGRARARTVEKAGRPSMVALVIGQIRHGLAEFSRSRSSAFWVLAFPSVLLTLFYFVFGNPTLGNRGGIPLVQFAAPVLGVFGVAMAAYADFSERTAFARDRGLLKRLRGTPLPFPAFLAGRILATVVIAIAALAITIGVGVAFFGVEVVPRMLPGVVVSVALGVGTFAALGLALAAVAPNAEAVPTIANATLLPLAFFSDIFLIGGPPAWMARIGSLFPLKHLANAVADGFNPTVGGAGFFPEHLAVMAVWFVVAVALAVRFFTWHPRVSAAEGSGRPRKKGAAPDPAAATVPEQRY